MTDREPRPPISDTRLPEGAGDPSFLGRLKGNRRRLNGLHPWNDPSLSSVKFDLVADPQTRADCDENQELYTDLLRKIGPDRMGKKVTAGFVALQIEGYELEFAEGKWEYEGSFGNPSTPIILVATLFRNDQGLRYVSQLIGFQADKLPEDVREQYHQAVHSALPPT